MLNKAHEGYEYQDLLTCYFILTEIEQDQRSEFTIDKKEFQGDRLDDLSIQNSKGVFKKQIKYSGPDSAHRLKKADLSTDSKYGLSLDALFHTWNHFPISGNHEFRLCLAWDEPDEELSHFLTEVERQNTFSVYPTKVYRVNPSNIWPENALPLISWRRLRDAAPSIERSAFVQFCGQLFIEVNMPKMSLDLKHAGDLENLVLEKVQQLGIGVFPNENLQPVDCVLRLLALVKRSRAKDLKLTSSSILHELNIISDFGSIQQVFPIIEPENIERRSIQQQFLSQHTMEDRIMILGEPGSGKSWFVENLQRLLRKKKIRVVRHYCYTSMEDALQKERIKVNIFYGNLISDILHAFPELERFKEQKFASNLAELNHLLENIENDTYIIIDGLDHIQRIKNFRNYTDIADEDMAIIRAIGQFKKSSFVKIILATQNVIELANITGFVQWYLPPLKLPEVKELLRKVKRPMGSIKHKTLLATLLLEKSQGNPLYIKYLMNEIKESGNPVSELLSFLPNYSYNLAAYYAYLLTKMDTRLEVPRILAGVNFSLTQTEIEEITHLGNYVADSLQILSPVLRLNTSQSGYIIYHESFRRFILEELRGSSMNIDKVVFQPVIDWFTSKEFYHYEKCYRFYLECLYDASQTGKVLSYLQPNFITESVVSGQPWSLIERNFRYLVKAACDTKNLPAVVLLNELNKILAGARNNLEEIFEDYFQLLGRLQGYDSVSRYLVYDGNANLSTEQGLKVCYACEKQGISAPWDIYMEPLKSSRKIQSELFPYFIKGLLVLQASGRLNRIAKKMMKPEMETFRDKLINEFKSYSNQEYINQLSIDFPAVAVLLNEPSSSNNVSVEQLIEKANKIISFENVFSREAPIIYDFFKAFRSSNSKTEALEVLIDRFANINWFYNWIIYYMRIIHDRSEGVSDFARTKEAFKYLVLDTSPFKGHPRVSDLYPIEPFIHQSLKEGLQGIETAEEWREIIDILVELSNETTVGLQKSIFGPLSTEALFKILSNHATAENANYLLAILEKQSLEKEEYHLHSYIADYNLKLSSIYLSVGDRAQSLATFRRAITYLLGYTMRKDMTLLDALEGIQTVASLWPQNGFEDLKKILVLVNSAVNHTDGKETQYFPNTWYQKLLEIDRPKAFLYLLHQISNTIYSWRAERSLGDLISVAKGSVNPVIEFYIASTLPLNSDHRFIGACLDICEKLDQATPDLSRRLMAIIIPAMQPRPSRSASNDLIERYNNRITRLKLKTEFEVKKEVEAVTCIVDSGGTLSPSPDILAMDTKKFIEYIGHTDVNRENISGIKGWFSRRKELDQPMKDLIWRIVHINSRKFSEKMDLDGCFQVFDDVECYYWVCRFLIDLGPWFERCANIEAFRRAWTIDSTICLQYIFELLPNILEPHFNMEFSSNLIKAFIAVGYDQDTTREMWGNVLLMTEYRLPFRDSIDWSEIFDNEFQLDEQETLMCIMLCRFMAGTTERYGLTIAAIIDVLNMNPEVMVKPIKWFIKNRFLFNESALLIVLQAIMDHTFDNPTYALNFKQELLVIFPTRIFAIDYVIAFIFDLLIPEIALPMGLVYPDAPPAHLRIMVNLNIRYGLFEKLGLNLTDSFNEYDATFPSLSQNNGELYGNRMYETVVPNVQGGNLLLNIINIKHYHQLKKISEQANKAIFLKGALLDLVPVKLYVQCGDLRPVSLPKPLEFQDGCSDHTATIDDGFVRVGHFEKGFGEDFGSRKTSTKSFGGILFGEKCPEYLPYLPYQLFPFQLWNPDLQLEVLPEIVLAAIQDDPIETYSLLWLNPQLIKHLELETKLTRNGPIASNQSGDTIMKMTTWKENYLGSDLSSGLNNEIPRLNGVQLLMRKDYFTKMCEIFPCYPKYFVVKSTIN